MAKAIASGSSIVIISIYYKSNILRIVYFFWVNFVALILKMLSLLQIKQGIDHLEVCNIIYENYNSFGKRHLLVSLEFFFANYIRRGGCLVSSQLATPMLLSP